MKEKTAEKKAPRQARSKKRRNTKIPMKFVTHDENNQTNLELQRLIDRSKALFVVAGDAASGTKVEYTGLLTVSAIKTRLSHERQGGMRFARIEAKG